MEYHYRNNKGKEKTLLLIGCSWKLRPTGKMKIIILLMFFLLGNNVYSQDIINQLKENYANADFDCYKEKIQKDINKMDTLLNLYWKEYGDIIQKWNIMLPYRPANIDLGSTNNIFVPAVTFVNMDYYKYEDNIYDYLRIDSLRTFIIVCVDEKLNILGYTDYLDIGTYADVKDDYYFYHKKTRKGIAKMLKEINKENPELILYCDRYCHDSSFFYVKEGKIYYYEEWSKRKKELNEDARSRHIDLIRVSDEFISEAKRMENKLKKEDEKQSIYRYRGNTSFEEVRLCP